MASRHLLISCLLIFNLGGALAKTRNNGDFSVGTNEQVQLNSGSLNPAKVITADSYASNVLQQMISALDVMQSHFYELWIGTWPTAIDWTGAVTNNALSAALKTVAKASNQTEDDDYSKTINRYFAHSTAYYFGEDAFSIRNEAYDDILWVVLGWLESIRFIEYRNATDASWHGTQFIPAFSHRARLFWDLASRGWDTELCGGGMTWNPNLKPYKNAITNQLFISASIAMYLYSPGDSIDFPFMASNAQIPDSMPGRAHDPKYLSAAVEGYTWLKSSNMTNNNGLYVDGYHITNWGHNGGIGTGKCDQRNEMIYTYNQGVILSGLRALWEATANTSYLEDGHQIIRNVMNSTGWTWSGQPTSPILQNPNFSGLGQHGILEELCDRNGDCSQDSQTFKGIYFHHLTQFCEPLPLQPLIPGKTHGATKALRQKHLESCRVIARWVENNAAAALRSRDAKGLFGMWWGHASSSQIPVLPQGAVDYRNNATVLFAEGRSDAQPGVLGEKRGRRGGNAGVWDVNDRGRGRTVETQQSGLAVLRAAWEFSNLPAS